jgi:uncharacterized protein YejL (UPF0352 family)
MEKLNKVQTELKAPKNQYNSFGKYKYRSCEDILEAVKPILKKHKVSITLSDEVVDMGGIVTIIATANFIDCESDNIISVQACAGVDPNRKGMDIAQSFGSSSSYARKYALNGLLLIDDTKDADSTNDHAVEKVKKTITTHAKAVIDIGSEKWEDCLKYVAQNNDLGFDNLIKALGKKYDFTPKAIKEIKKKVK